MPYIGNLRTGRRHFLESCPSSKVSCLSELDLIKVRDSCHGSVFLHRPGCGGIGEDKITTGVSRELATISCNRHGKSANKGVSCCGSIDYFCLLTMDKLWFLPLLGIVGALAEFVRVMDQFNMSLLTHLCTQGYNVHVADPTI